jgi:hypothetical protein
MLTEDGVDYLRLPDDLASQVRLNEHQLPRILELGLRELNASSQSGFDGAAEVLELLAALPGPEEIMNLRPSRRLSDRVAQLVEKAAPAVGAKRCDN